MTHDQLQEAKSDILCQFEKNVSELKAAFERLEKENVELRSRVDELERKLQALSTGKVSGPDVAFRRLSFIGLPLNDPEARVKFVKEWMTSNFSSFTFSVGNVFRGPVSKRVLTAVAYVEFPDADTRNLVLSRLKTANLPCKFSGVDVAVKPALSQFVRERIWALNTAYDLIKAHPAASGQVVLKVKGKEGGVTVGGTSVFTQSGVSGLGSFSGSFSGLSLPGK